MALTVLYAPSTLASEYQVNVGDVLEISAAGIPDFRHRGTVGADGEVTFPLIGGIAARDRPIRAILQEVRTRMPQKVLRRRNPDGSAHDIIIDGDEVAIAVVEYSPVYLSGDVASPGSYPFRPGLTVRQAVTLAGGYDMLRTRMENPYLLTADLRSQHEVLLNDYTRLQARITRLQSELGQGPQAPDVQENSPTATEIRELEAEQLDTRKADYEKEKQHLTDSVRSLSSNLSLLEKQLQTEAERAKVDQEDMTRVEGLVAKGMAPVTRLSDVRRLVLLSASRATEIEARAEQVRQRRAEESRKLQKLTDVRRLELLQDLQEAKIALAAAASRLSATAEKMFLVGAVRSQISRGQTGVPRLSIFRRSGSGTLRLAAAGETELLPGDVIEIELQIDGVPVGTSSQPAPRDTSPRSQPRENFGALMNQPKAQ